MDERVFSVRPQKIGPLSKPRNMILHRTKLLDGQISLPRELCELIESYILSQEDIRVRCLHCKTPLLADLHVQPLKSEQPFLWWMRRRQLYIQETGKDPRRLIPCLPCRGPTYTLPLALPGASGFFARAPTRVPEHIRVGSLWYRNLHVQMNQLAWYKALPEGMVCLHCFTERRRVRRRFERWKTAWRQSGD